MSIQKRIAKIPGLLGIKNQSEFARVIGISPQHMSNIMNRDKGIGVDIVASILNKYPINPYWLILGKGDPIITSEEQKNMSTTQIDRLSSDVDWLKEMVNKLLQSQD